MHVSTGLIPTTFDRGRTCRYMSVNFFEDHLELIFLTSSLALICAKIARHVRPRSHCRPIQHRWEAWSHGGRRTE